MLIIKRVERQKQHSRKKEHTMKPSIQDINTLNNKTAFLSWLLSRFGENEFTNSEMKKVYDEDVSNAFLSASFEKIERAIKKFNNDVHVLEPEGLKLISADVLAKKGRVACWFRNDNNKTCCNRIYYHNQLMKYIDPSLCFPKSYTLNEAFGGCQFYTTRKENITIRTKKAVGIVPTSSGCRYVKKDY